MKQKLIMLVEDNRDDEELTLLTLQQNNLRNPVVIARDGVEALDYLFGRGAHANRSVQAQPALVLLDLKLPRLDGLEVLRQMRADRRTKYVPVVVLTSSREDADILASYEFGANSYVRKPVDYEDFTTVIRQLGFFWLLLNETVRQHAA